MDFCTESRTAVAGEDFEHTSGTVTFADKEWSKEIRIQIHDDDECEEDEIFLVKLSNPRPDCQLGTITSTEITIIDDDGKQ